MNSRQDRPVMVRFSDVINASNSLQRIGSDRIQRKRVETRALILYYNSRCTDSTLAVSDNN